MNIKLDNYPTLSSLENTSKYVKEGYKKDKKP